MVVYVILALASGVVLLGMFPVLLSIRAVKRKEPLAPVAVIAAVVAVGVALLALA